MLMSAGTREGVCTANQRPPRRHYRCSCFAVLTSRFVFSFGSEYVEPNLNTNREVSTRKREQFVRRSCFYNVRMLALRYAYVLALVLWLGGMVVLGAIVAPATFQVLEASAPAVGRALAGALFGTILARFHYVAY